MNSKYILVLGFGAALAACSSSNPSPPNIGAQIDRMGRPAVNTALTNPFDTVSGQTPDTIKDAYNGASDPSMWAPSFVGGPPTGGGAGQFGTRIAGNLAILDGLDGTCGNQQPVTASQTGSNKYVALANVLADDQLYVNSNGTACQTYLGVEANAVNLLPNSDCGGRTPLENVIDETYSLLAAGALMGVTNGITQDGDGTASLTSFPFLANPN